MGSAHHRFINKYQGDDKENNEGGKMPQETRIESWYFCGHPAGIEQQERTIGIGQNFHRVQIQEGLVDQHNDHFDTDQKQPRSQNLVCHHAGPLHCNQNPGKQGLRNTYV